LALTEAGQAFAPAAQRILEQLAEAGRETRGELTKPTDELGIAASTLFGQLHMMPIIADILTEYPDIDIRLATCFL
jgi:DNA-binding transcriptional LysR family regulator